mgnify:CR=1 FL=1
MSPSRSLWFAFALGLVGCGQLWKPFLEPTPDTCTGVFDCLQPIICADGSCMGGQDAGPADAQPAGMDWVPQASPTTVDLFAVWVAGGWLLDPQLPALPSPVEKAWIFEHFMPLFGVAIALYVKGMLPASVLWTASALVMVTLLAASGLAAWLSWRNVDREALRRLNLALSLCVLSAAWFCRLRGLIYDEHRDLALMLDYPFMLAGFIGGWAPIG